MSLFQLVLGTVAVGVTAFLLATTLRLRSVVDFLLAMYLLGFAETVVVSLLLSPGHWLSQANLLWALLGVLVAAVALWYGLGRPRAPSFRTALTACREALRDPLVAVLAVAVAGAFGYVAALIIGTAPNDYDALWYHLARAAFWKQQHAVAYIAGANDARLNGFPPNAEILDAFTMILGRTERFVGFVQLAALLAAMVAVAGIARRIGLTVRQALFGALLFATLPVVILQSATALNDLVFGALLACCAYFLFTWRPATLALSALALGLALGTKFTAVLALPLLAIFGAFIHPRRRWPALVLVGVGGIVLGAYWYLLNVAKTHHINGRVAEAQNATTLQHGNTRSVGGTIAHLMRLAIDAVDPSGALGRDRFLYLVAAGLILMLGLRVRGRMGTGLVVVAGALAALPLAFRWIDHELLHGYQKLWLELDRREVAFLGFDKHLTRASPFQSWYGAAGLLLVLACLWLAWRGWRRGSLPRGAVALALAPAAWLALQSITTFYSLFDGRYVVFAVALGAALWGLVLPIRWLAWASTGIAVVALTLVLVHYDEKPSGVSVLGGSAPTSVWGLSRAQVLARALHPGENEVVATLEREAKKGQTIALAIRREDVSYPFFGEKLDRRVVFVNGPPQTFRQGPDWIVVAPGARKPVTSWVPRRVVNSNGWRLYRVTPS